MAKKYRPTRSALLPKAKAKRPDWMNDPNAVEERYGPMQYDLFDGWEVDGGPIRRDPASEDWS